MQPRSIPQNRKFSAMVGDVAAQFPLAPWRRPLAREAWKRFFIQAYVIEAREEAQANGWPDPFPTGSARSRDLDIGQMNELIECTLAYAAMQLDLVLE